MVPVARHQGLPASLTKTHQKVWSALGRVLLRATGFALLILTELRWLKATCMPS